MCYLFQTMPYGISSMMDLTLSIRDLKTDDESIDGLFTHTVSKEL
jgi:hypothetical protein